MRVEIHPWAREGFGRAAEAYEQGRPGYPPEAVSWLVERMSLGPGRTVVDIGAGTGKLSRLLVPTGAHVVAVEPVAAMRRLLRRLAPVEVVAGSAEAVPLPDARADAVTVAEAFHWFRGEDALAEIHRVLRPGCSLALLWNRPDLTDPLQAALHEIVERYRGHAPVLGSGAWRKAFEETPLFTRRELRTFPNAQALDVEGLVGRAVSESSIAILPEERRSKVVAEVRELARSRPKPLVLRYLTEVHLCTRL